MSQAPVGRRSYLLRNLCRFPTLRALRRSAFYSKCCGEIESILLTPELVSRPGIKPRLSSYARAAQWNIEKGKRLQEIIALFRENNILKWADIILLNEADYGMSRSGNLHVAQCLAQALEMNMAFAPAHFELTRGTDEDLNTLGENEESLQGNAVLSRYPIIASRVLPLPTCFEPFEFHEKRYGKRNCVWAKLRIGDGAIWVGSVHLEVRKIPSCRAIQMGHLLRHLPGKADDAYLVGGDFNANGFSRGNSLHTMASIWRLVRTSESKLREEFRHPERIREPLFHEAGRAGFSWEGFNSDQETACAPLGNLEDASMVPGFLVRNIRKRLMPFEGYLSFKLDWFLGRGVRGLHDGEVVDSGTGVSSLLPGSVTTLRRGSARISDHSPIHADLPLPH